MAGKVCSGKTLYPKRVRLIKVIINKGTEKGIILKLFGKIIISNLPVAVIANNKRHIRLIVIILVY